MNQDPRKRDTEIQDNAQTEGFVLSSSPHFHSGSSTKMIMFTTLAALIPAIAMAVFYFGTNVLFLLLTGTLVSVFTEVLVKLLRRKSWRSVYDGSAILTGMLLVLTLPAGIPPLFVAIGCSVAILIGKEVFGGLGSNIFNPALVGRAFLSSAYPVQMTTWQPVSRIFEFLPTPADSVSGATPLAAARFDSIHTSPLALFLGQTSGSIGETSVVALVVGGLVLLIFGIARWQKIFSFLGAIYLLGSLFHLINPEAFPTGLFHLFSGGVVFSAIFMITDPVTTPITNFGGAIYGVSVALIVIVIRLFGGYPEGVMYAVLLMNGITPIIDRVTKSKTFGHGKDRLGES